jgi:polyvinyl alcohol dehydrogenase (cytochrome)
VAIANSNHTSYTLADGSTNTGGSWSALSPADGHIIWQVADPTPGVGDPGAVSVANGVLYAGSISGFMYGIRADSGTVLFSFSSGGSVIDGPSIANGRIYWGSGYPKAPGLPNNKVYAFSLPGH